MKRTKIPKGKNVCVKKTKSRKGWLCERKKLADCNPKVDKKGYNRCCAGVLKNAQFSSADGKKNT